MGNGYTRNDTANNIADGNVINASDLDGEFDKLQTAFDGTSGHSHDGTSGEGPQIAAGGLANNAVTTDKIANDAVTLGTKTSGNYVAAGATSGTGISGSVSSEGGTFTVTSNATNANTASTIVARDGSGNFSAGNVTVGNLITSGNVDGRDVSADGTKLDGIESGATADQTAAEIRTLVESASDSNVFTDADHSKLNGIEGSADVTDTANVTAAGALMDSELTNITAVKALDQGVATTDSPTFAALTLTTADINGGTVDNATIGATTPAAGTFTDLTADLLSITNARPSIRPSLNLDFVNNEVIDPRIDFTRSTTATYYDGKTMAKA